MHNIQKRSTSLVFYLRFFVKADQKGRFHSYPQTFHKRQKCKAF